MAKRTKQSDSDEENKKAVNPAAGAGCLIAFASPFAVLGLILLGLVGRDLYRYSAVQSWAPTPATILDAQLTTRHSTKGATTFQATARYRYLVNGKAYESRRVSLHAGSDNFGDFQRQRADELKKALSAGTPITAYVNQGNPGEAILFRDLRPGMLAIKALGGMLVRKRRRGTNRGRALWRAPTSTRSEIKGDVSPRAVAVAREMVFGSAAG